MSYTAPAGNSVAFVTTGVSYTAPAGNVLNFLWFSTPTVVFAGSSTAVFVGLVSFTGTINIQGSTTPYFEHPYRAPVISGSTTAAFDTWLRSPNIATASTSNFMAGVTAVSTGAATVTIAALPLVRTVATLSSSTTVSPVWSAIVGSAYASSGRTYMALQKRDNQPVRAVVFSGGKFTPQPRSINNSAGSFLAGSIFSPRNRNLFNASYTASTAATVAASSAYALPAAASVFSSTLVTFAGVNTHARPFSSSGVTTAAFASNFAYNTPLPVPSFDNVVFAKPRNKDIFVGAKA